MKIKSATFVKGVLGSDEILFNGKFQIALMGRSNVGKSTLINSLTMKKNLARSSSSPDKTIRKTKFLLSTMVKKDYPSVRLWELQVENCMTTV